MGLPLRSLAVFAAGTLCFSSCLSARSLHLQPARSLSPGPADVASSDHSAPPPETVVIPGPLRSFLRMAGISQQVPLDEVLPMLARNITLWGHENGRDTEFLILLTRYVDLARQLQALAGADGVIRVTGCDDAGRLIQVLGYQFERGCGPDGAALVTSNAERAFLTIDSGFPITALEQSLEKNTPFTYAFPGTQAPILFQEKDWTSISAWKKKADQSNLLDVLLHDPGVERLYAAMDRCDPETRLILARSPGLRRLLPVAPVFDFYGSQITIRSGTVVVPGGTDEERDWHDLVGASPHAPAEFTTRLLAKDRGWLAAYFDALARVSPEQQASIVQGGRLKTLYDSYRSPVANDSASAGVFPKNTELLLLLTRLHWQANGDPRVPGDLADWSEIFTRDAKTLGYHDWAKRGRDLNTPTQLLGELVAASNVETDVGPLQAYLQLSAIEDGRPDSQPLSRETVRLLAANFVRFYNWYSIFSEFPALEDASISAFVDAADRVDKIPNPSLRANALGSFQADVGLWQIFARQGQIPAAALNTSWQNAIRPFASISSSQQLFEAARGSLGATLLAVSGSANLTQDQIVELLAGPAQQTDDGRRVHQELARRIRSVLDDQRLVSLDTLFGLNDGLHDMARGARVGDSLIQLAGNLREFELPRPIFTEGEKTTWSPVIYTNRHAELQVRTDLTSVIRTPGTAVQLEAARGRLTPFLRDTLVGLNYAYYEPPGAQVLHNNPLFVRSHDFSTVSVQGVQQIWGAPELIGIGVTAGGGAYLMGSLADLPYALASVEQDFIAPENVQALIWKETVPQLLVGAVLPRWWSVSVAEMHAAALYQRAGEELLVASSTNPDLRQKVEAILADHIAPGRLDRIDEALRDPNGTVMVTAQVLPASTFYLAAEFRRRYPDRAASWGPAGRELDDLARAHPADADPARISRDFGVPHPAMEQSDSCMLANTGLFPVSGGYTSRLFGESWESSNLYWARLSDEMGYSPVMLNILVPELTRRMIVKIFATNIDDWPALLRAMQETGDEFRHGKIAVQAPNTASGQ
ncbi:MAG: hypothetical protein WBE38_15375 [Terracidiphilus sp.]|jgi:hypothetical protein